MIRPLAASLLILGTALSGCIQDAALLPRPPADEEGLEESQAGDEAPDEPSAPAPPPPNGSEPPEPAAPQPREPFSPGWPSLDRATVRPGVVIAGGCTSNFLFRSADNRSLYIGTAAHCVEELAIGDKVDIGGGAASGRLAYSSWMAMKDLGDDAGVGQDNDFALVRIDDADRDVVHPAVLHYGGPSAIAPGAQVGGKVMTFGNSNGREAVGDAADPREGYVYSATDWYALMYLASPSIPGDSGSAVLTGDGRALGIMIHLIIAPFAASNGVVLLDPALAFARDKAGMDVELVTWESLDSGLLPDLP